MSAPYYKLHLISEWEAISHVCRASEQPSGLDEENKVKSVYIRRRNSLNFFVDPTVHGHLHRYGISDKLVERLKVKLQIQKFPFSFNLLINFKKVFTSN